MTIFGKILAARIADLWKLYEATGELSHQGEKGLFREIFVRQLLESVLPFQYGLGGGVVVDAWGRQSPQADLIIYDRRLMPPIFEAGSHGIYPMDAVMRVIEVKSILDTKGLSQLRGLAESLHPNTNEGLKISAPGNLADGLMNYPVVGMFAYDTRIPDLKTKRSQALGQYDNEVHVCVARNDGGDRVGVSMHAIRSFSIVMLDSIEVSSRSRSEYRVAGWLRDIKQD